MFYVEFVAEERNSNGSSVRVLEWYTEGGNSYTDVVDDARFRGLDEVVARASRFARILAERGEVSMVVWRRSLERTKRTTIYMKMPVSACRLSVIIHWIHESGRPVLKWHDDFEVHCFDDA